MSKQRDRERAEAQGFKDALVSGRRGIGVAMPDHERVAYDRGFKDGLRAVTRIQQERP